MSTITQVSREALQLCLGLAFLSLLGGMVMHHKHTQAVQCTAPENLPPVQEEKVIQQVVESYGVKSPESRLMAMAIVDAAQKEQVPSTLIVAMVFTESTFNGNAKSKKNAVGYMQVRPKWWDSKTPYNLKDKYENLYAGAWVLGHYEEKTGNLDEAVKAYNIGLTDYNKGRSVAAADRYYGKVSAEFKKVQNLYNQLKGV